MENVINFFLNTATAVFNWLFVTPVISTITFGDMILYFGLVYLAVIYMRKLFWK